MSPEDPGSEQGEADRLPSCQGERAGGHRTKAPLGHWEDTPPGWLGFHQGDGKTGFRGWPESKGLGRSHTQVAPWTVSQW